MENNQILVTGAAGFIGYHLCKCLISSGKKVIGIDNLNDYYDTKLKRDRLHELGIDRESKINYNKYYHSKRDGGRFIFIKIDLSDRKKLPDIFNNNSIHTVVNLAAQAGVRFSIDSPFSYVDSNLMGFSNLLECCRKYPINKLVYASSSSVYGDDSQQPLNENSKSISQKSFYAVTKRANELMANNYSDLFGIEAIGLRFFTVYGPWGRPDMAPYLFSKAIINGKSINVFNKGELYRDFTYIEDIVDGIVKVLELNKKVGHKILNIGNGNPIKLLDFISILEGCLEKKAKKNFIEMQQGDVYKTWADLNEIKLLTNYEPKVNLSKGIKEFVNWYKDYHHLH